MTLQALFTFLGGIGLFLLGMRLMTDGLKAAAGNTLRDILIAATQSRRRALASGILITTMVQSSSAVIFATIGFVNAGLLTLTQAIGVIYGSNVGTTLTSWLVAVIGFNVNLQALALPAIGIGTGLWVTLGQRRWGSIGQALAGFGLFFLGIDILKGAFSGGNSEWLDMISAQGAISPLLFVLVGTALTVMMQSSSAALAVTLTAAGGGIIALPDAAAMVIGANIGTTSTALFAIIGATSAAKRAALAHVSFNVITGIVALLCLPLLLAMVQALSRWLGLGDQPAVLLAVFHTSTKVLGLIIMWPLTERLVRQLERWFVEPATGPVRPKYLDRNVQTTPSLAMDALAMELQHMKTLSNEGALQAINSSEADAAPLQQIMSQLDTLNLAVGEFAAGIQSKEQDSLLSNALPHALRVGQYHLNVIEDALELNRHNGKAPLNHDSLNQGIAILLAEAVHCFTDQPQHGEGADNASFQSFQHHYDQLKQQLLMAGARGHISPAQMARQLERIHALQRMVQQRHKAERYYATYQAERALPKETPDDADQHPPAN